MADVRRQEDAGDVGVVGGELAVRDQDCGCVGLEEAPDVYVSLGFCALVLVLVGGLGW